MRDEKPTYAKMAEEQDQLNHYLRSALTQSVEELGFHEPLIVACLAVNGSVVVIRTEGEHVEDLASHTEGPGFTPPINVLITDARGEAMRLLITSEGMTRSN